LRGNRALDDHARHFRVHVLERALVQLRIDVMRNADGRLAPERRRHEDGQLALEAGACRFRSPVVLTNWHVGAFEVAHIDGSRGCGTVAAPAGLFLTPVTCLNGNEAEDGSLLLVMAAA